MARRKQHIRGAGERRSALALTCVPAFDLTAAADGKPKRPTFEMLAYSGGAMRIRGWAFPVVIDVEGIRARQTVPIYLNHDDTRLVGQSTSVSIGEGRVSLSGIVTGDNEAAQEVLSHAKNGFAWQASVGLPPDRVEDVRAGERVTVNGKVFSGPIHVVRKGRLGEVSFVAVGADEDSAARVAASKEISRMAKNKGAGIEPVIEEPGEESTDALQAERDRQSDIKAVAARFLQAHPSQGDAIEAIVNAGISEGLTPDATELQLIRAMRPKVAPPVRRESGSAIRSDSPKDFLAASLLHRLGEGELCAKLYGAQLAEVAKHKGPRSMVEMCRCALELAHVDVPRDTHEMIRAAGSSTTALPTALGATAEKIALQQFDYNSDTWRAIAKVVPVSNFKDHTLIRVNQLETGTSAGFKELAPGGELKNLNLGESTHTVRASTHGKLVSLDRRDIINDDLSLFSQVAEMLGRMGAGLVNKLVVEAIMGNAGSFFSSGNSNYQEGVGTALSETSLGTLVALLRKQTDAAGDSINITPKVLLVPPELETTARKLLLSLEIGYSANSNAGTPTYNIFSQMGLIPVVEARLSNSNYTGYSTSAFYLFGAPQFGAVHVAFLNGKQGPTVESADVDFDRLGMQWRGFIDVGVALGEYRAAAKSKGAA